MSGQVLKMVSLITGSSTILKPVVSRLPENWLTIHQGTLCLTPGSICQSLERGGTIWQFKRILQDCFSFPCLITQGTVICSFVPAEPVVRILKYWWTMTIALYLFICHQAYSSWNHRSVKLHIKWQLMYNLIHIFRESSIQFLNFRLRKTTNRHSTADRTTFSILMIIFNFPRLKSILTDCLP